MVPGRVTTGLETPGFVSAHSGGGNGSLITTLLVIVMLPTYPKKERVEQGLEYKRELGLGLTGWSGAGLRVQIEGL